MTSEINIPKFSGMEAGERHHRLTAVAFVRRNKRGKAVWKFQCECGTTLDVVATFVRIGRTKSCGCLSRETAAAKGRASATHGMHASPEYRSWAGMIQRCCNARDTGYQGYGGRGITVCDRWRAAFEAFYADMGPMPSPKHTIERIKNDGSYCKENCKWATKKEQSRNRRCNRIVVVNGIKMSVAEAAERAGLNYDTFVNRLNRGWPVALAVESPPGFRR